MVILPRLIIIIPLALATVGMILSALSLFAGHETGFMEEYAIVRVNVSRIGYDLIKIGSNDDAEEEDDDDEGFFDSIKDTWDGAKDAVIDEINDLVGGVTGEIADAIGISDWYSVHVMNACEGSFTPNGTAKDTSINTTDCSDSKAGYRFDLKEIIDTELSLGPFDIDLNDLGWTDDIQDNIDILNDGLLAFFVLYALAMAFCGLSIIGCIVAFVLPERKSVALITLLVTILAMGILVIVSIITTVGVTKGVQKINRIATRIGVQVQKGDKFLAISWAAAAVMIVASVFWTTRFLMIRKKNKILVRSKI